MANVGEFQKREFDAKVESTKIADDLRKLADQIERDSITSFTRIDIGHFHPVTSMGMVTDHQFLGWTMVVSTMSIPGDVTNDVRDLIEGRSVAFERRLPPPTRPRIENAGETPIMPGERGDVTGFKDGGAVLTVKRSEPVPGNIQRDIANYYGEGLKAAGDKWMELTRGKGVEVAVNGPANPLADIELARLRVESKVGLEPHVLDGCSIDSISPDSGDVLIISCQSGNIAQREAIVAAVNRINVPIPCIVIPDEVIVESWSLDEIRQFRDRLNEVIYDREQQR